MAGLRPGTPDNAPVIGPSDLPGLVLATGHFRSGVLLTPVTADLIAELLVTGTARPAAAAIHPRSASRPPTGSLTRTHLRQLEPHGSHDQRRAP